MSELGRLEALIETLTYRVNELEKNINQQADAIEILNQSIVGDRQIMNDIKELKQSYLELSRQIIDVEKSMIDAIKERITDALPELLEYRASEIIENPVNEESEKDKELNLL